MASVLDQPVHVEDDDDGPRTLRGRRRTTLIFTVVVSLIVALALVEALLDLPGYGVDGATTSASRGEDVVTVRYARVTRGQLVSPLEVRVQRAGGFQAPVTVTISSAYFNLFITNDVSPQPTSETSTESSDILTFDPPPTGEVLDITWDIVAKPSGWFESRTGRVTVLGEDGRPTASASFHTKVRP
jgi:hypothetical protein